MTVHQCIDRRQMHEVFASHLVQGVEHGNLEVLDVAVQLVLPEVHGLIAIDQQFPDEQFMHHGSRSALRGI